jgi:hypothetical protein
MSILFTPSRSRPAEHEAHVGPTEPVASGLRARALVVGLLLVVAISVISVYGDMVTKTVQFGVLQLAPPAVVSLLLLVLVNKALSRLAKRVLLGAADMLVIYTMLLVGVMVSTRGAIEKVIPALAYLPYHSTTSMRYNDLVTRYLPKWILPFVPTAATACPEGLREYYEGLTRGHHVPFAAWVGPLAAMFVLVACVVWVFVCLSVLVRKQWVESERLSFPLTALPLALIRDEIDGEPFLKSPGMWGGFALSFLVFLVNGVHVNYPAMPQVPLIYNLNSYLRSGRGIRISTPCFASRSQPSDSPICCRTTCCSHCGFSSS